MFIFTKCLYIEGGDIIVDHVLQTMDEVISNEYDINHQALDIVSQNNTPSEVIALESGIVENVVKNVTSTNHNSKGLDTYGNYVKIKQNNGKSALYAHMKYGSVNVNLGDYVEKGAIIGTMGETGNAYGKHLHLEIKNENNTNENPILSLNEPKESQTPKNNQVKPETSTSLSMEVNTSNNQIKQSIPQITEDSNLSSHYNGGSIVDGLKSINVDSSYNYRCILAKENGIDNYHGTYEQNVFLLKLLKEGKLKKA